MANGTQTAELRLNTAANIVIDNDEQGTAFLVDAPIRGQRLRSMRIDSVGHPAAYAFLQAALVERKQDARPDTQGLIELSDVGLFVCDDDIPSRVDYRVADSDPADAGALLFQHAKQSESAQTALSRLRIPAQWRDPSIAFARDAETALWAPVLVDGDARARPEVDPSDSEKLSRNLDSAASCEQFQRERFVELQGLIPAAHVTEMGRYFGALADEGYLTCLEDRGSCRFVSHSHPLARFWHEQLNDRVSRLAGKATKPSYCFVSVYAEGGELRWHTDRPPCEYTVALLLACTPLGPGEQSPWALQVEDRHGKVHAIHQRVGEGLAFRGRELRHCRDVLPQGLRSTSLMLHYVDEDYSGEMI